MVYQIEIMITLLSLNIGNKDPIIDINWARLSEECFKAMGFKQYIFKEYDGMVHTNTEQVRVLLYI
jgi:hypothetical protein